MNIHSSAHFFSVFLKLSVLKFVVSFFSSLLSSYTASFRSEHINPVYKGLYPAMSLFQEKREFKHMVTVLPYLLAEQFCLMDIGSGRGRYRASLVNQQQVAKAVIRSHFADASCFHSMTRTYSLS